MLHPGTRKRLTPGAAKNFPEETLFHRLARAVCEANCLPRKELFESWEVAKRVRRRFKGGRVVDLACGHGLLAFAMVLLDQSSHAIAVDRNLPISAGRLSASLDSWWPLKVELIEAELDSIELGPDDVVVSVHACGHLTDLILDRAVAARARVAVVPCCHPVGRSDTCGLEGWIDGALAMDVVRATSVRARGYDVWTASIPADITPKNRLLMAAPRAC